MDGLYILNVNLKMFDTLLFQKLNPFSLKCFVKNQARSSTYVNLYMETNQMIDVFKNGFNF